MPAFLSTVLVALGWAGAVAGITAYTLVSRGKWEPKSVQFQATNAASAVFMGIAAARAGAWPSVASNIIWFAVGMQTLATITSHRTRKSARTPASQPAAPMDAAELVHTASAEDAAAELVHTASPDLVPNATDLHTAVADLHIAVTGHTTPPLDATTRAHRPAPVLVNA